MITKLEGFVASVTPGLADTDLRINFHQLGQFAYRLPQTVPVKESDSVAFSDINLRKGQREETPSIGHKDYESVTITRAYVTGIAPVDAVLRLFRVKRSVYSEKGKDLVELMRQQSLQGGGF